MPLTVDRLVEIYKEVDGGCSPVDFHNELFEFAQDQLGVSYGERETTSDAAERMWPGISFDTALPQDWVNKIQSEKYWRGMDVDFSPLGHFVWGYPENAGMLGTPLPVTAKGATFLYWNGGL